MPTELQEITQIAPTWLISMVVIVVVTAIVAVAHSIAVRRGSAALAERHPLISEFLQRSRRPIRYGIVVVGLGLMVRASPLAGEVGATIGSLFTVAFVALAAWATIVFLDLAAAIHLRRFELDVEDNLQARKHYTQVRILRRTAQIVVIILAVGAALMSFEEVRQYGVSILASAGAAGLVLGIAAQPVLSNLLAGVQLALTQPIRIDDAVVVEGEWGWIEEITATYVVIRIWDWRRLIVPLRYFIENPFQNWTRERAAIIGSVLLHADYTVPVEDVRRRLNEIVKSNKLWDGDVVNLQVTDANERTVTLRALVSARNSPAAWDLRCEVREQLIAYLQERHPGALPRFRAGVDIPTGPMPAGAATTG